MQEETELLANIPLFSALDEMERADLLPVLGRERRAAGERIFQMGEPGDSMYIVAAGSVSIFVKDVTGARIDLDVCKSGDFFGELSLFDGGARTASAVAAEDVELLVLDRGDLLKFIRRRPDTALDFLTVMGNRVRSADALLRKTVSRNVNEEMETRATLFERFADAIALFSGSMLFLGLNAGWFATWIIWNVLPGLSHFDPYPFGFLTMVVSLEAIFLSIFVLISQNRQGEKDRVRSDVEYQVNVKAELEVAHLLEKVDFLTEEVLARMPRQERANGAAQIPTDSGRSGGPGAGGRGAE